MKTKFTMLFGTILLYINLLESQKLPSIVIAGSESKNTNVSAETVTDMFNLEYKKLNLFDVLDKHDAQQITSENKIELNSCFNKTCLQQITQILKVEKAVSCQLEKFNDKIYISIRQIDGNSGEVEKNFSIEFLSIEKEIQLMCEITLQKMYGLPVNEQKFKQLTTIQSQESTINNPEVSRLNLNGPRFGFGYILGRDGESFKRAESQGGFDAFPVLSQFGYQFEVAYLNQGNIQGLFEFVPSISGIEHGAFIPSIAILHGVRSNKSGLEFAVGPVLVAAKRTLGYYNENNNWIRKVDIRGPLSEEIENKLSSEIDRRGNLRIEGGLVIAIGKSIRSGSVNFPINIYCILKKDSPRLGFSMGFNTKK
ncbi:MAG: hypothetical protein IT267_11160 [Saprospiraceae bacterium]|nr:hypothetical protein [Saprospiraceae bacterium]